MNLFSNNTFRVLGVCSNASLKDIQKNISKLKAFAKIGKEMELDYDLLFLNLCKIKRTDDLLLKSENHLNLDKNKITSSLFWFADLTPIDSVALAHLIKGDVNKAIEIWDKATKSKEVSLKNYSAFNNLSTLLLLNVLDDSKTDTFKKDKDSIIHIKKGFELKNKFISSTFFNDYCKSICKSVPISSDDAQEFFTNTILDLFNKNFSPKELTNLFENLDNKIKDSLNASLVEAPISNIKSHIESAKNLVEKNKKSGIKVGKKLIKDTLKDIKYLKEISSPDDFQFQSISDKLSNQILQCGIDCYNKTSDDQAYLSSYQYALSIAQSEKVRNRAKDCIKHCKEEKEANTCPFCETNTVDFNSPYTIHIYKVTSRDYSGVNYQHGPLKLYYCKECSDSVKDMESKRKTIGWIAAVLCFIISLGFMGEEMLVIAGIGAFVAYIVASALTSFYTSFFSSNNVDIYQHPVLKKHLSQGWTTTQPTAN